MNEDLHCPSSPFQGLREGKPMLVARAGTGSIQDTGVWLFLAIVISALPEDWIRMHELPWQQAALSLTGLVIFCLFVEPFFFPFNLSEKVLIWIFSIIFLPEYFLDRVVNQQFLFLFMFPLSETGWRVEYETRSYLNASLQLRKQAFFQGKTFAGVLSGCGSWSKALLCVSVLIFVGAEPPGSIRHCHGCFLRCSDLTTAPRGQHFCPLHSRRFVRVSEKLLA